MKQGQTKPKLLLLSSEIAYDNNPTKVFQLLCEQRTETMLMESSEVNSKENLKSLLIVDSALRVTAKKDTVFVEALSANGASLLGLLDQHFTAKQIISSTPHLRAIQIPYLSQIKNDDDELTRLTHHSILDVLRVILKLVDASHENNQAIFMGGLFSYELIQCFENFKDVNIKNNCPDFCFYLAETLLTLDHQTQTGHLQASLFTPNVQEQQRLLNRLIEIQNILLSAPANTVDQQVKQTQQHQASSKNHPTQIEVKCDQSDEVFAQKIVELQKYIQAGDIFQIVPSRTFSLPCTAPLNSYQKLKDTNPSPYMFYIQDKDFTLFGSSPESALKFSASNRQVEIYPIAGTRPRGLNPDGSVNLDLDSRIELEMLTNHKEVAEHVMLVDLGRDDVARICEAGSRYVTDLTKVDRYSQVMHLVSRVVGTLKPELDAFHAYQACMNMGTLTGAPKLKAMELIYETEQQTRGSYGGAVGYFTATGDFDTCIVIRSAHVENNIAHVQAGAGIVLDSNPQQEAQETAIKAKAVLKAIISAQEELA